MAEKTPPNRNATDPGARYNRSRITNGTALHGPGVNGNTAEARRWRDLFRSFNTSKPGLAGQHLARRAATLCIQLERMDAASARGEEVDGDLLVRLSNSMTRCLESLGLTTAPQPAPVDPRAEVKRILQQEAEKNDHDD